MGQVIQRNAQEDYRTEMQTQEWNGDGYQTDNNWACNHSSCYLSPGIFFDFVGEQAGMQNRISPDCDQSKPNDNLYAAK